jgi:hypothetical protein
MFSERTQGQQFDGPIIPSLQLCVLGLSLLQDGDVGVGVFPEGEEVLVSGASLGEGIAWERRRLACSLLLPAGGRDAREPSETSFEGVGAALPNSPIVLSVARPN